MNSYQNSTLKHVMWQKYLVFTALFHQRIWQVCHLRLNISRNGIFSKVNANPWRILSETYSLTSRPTSEDVVMDLLLQNNSYTSIISSEFPIKSNYQDRLLTKLQMKHPFLHPSSRISSNNFTKPSKTQQELFTRGVCLLKINLYLILLYLHSLSSTLSLMLLH